MVMPSGRRISTPGPLASISGKAPKMAAMVVIMMGRKRVRQARRIAARASRPSRRSASSAKSTIMMAFFLTMPISRNTPISAIRVNSWPSSIRASSAPMPADGSVDRMVSGCTRLSYRMPSTIYIVTSAARISHGWRASVFCSSAAVPWKPAWIWSDGRPIRATAASMAPVAWSSDTPGDRLNEIVSATNSPWWLTDSGALATFSCAKAASGTRWPSAAITCTCLSDSISCAKRGSTPMTTWYWFSGP
ncbi:Uncharacterised protein [Bordetella pertussis]|nr:Uncharacterised protein [Bordetella pertussis]CPK88281.1 Uncharacterised protein [Bordetella pertussis]CPO51219.1 Uncharacterised protein [Bordetella pertussis]